MNNETPRTDAQYKEYARRDNDVKCVDIDFARTLELELQAAKNENVELQELKRVTLERYLTNHQKAIARKRDELAASEARLRATLKQYNEAVASMFTAGGWNDGNNEQLIRAQQDGAKLLFFESATPPSDALKPWVKLAKHCQNSDVIQNYLANGRPHGSNRVNPDGCECDDCQQYDHLAKIDKQARQLLESIGEKV